MLVSLLHCMLGCLLEMLCRVLRSFRQAGAFVVSDV